MADSYIDFTLLDDERFAKLVAIFNALRDAKRGDFPDAEDDYWRTFFDDRSLEHFWWPTPEELADWQQRWESTPVDRRFNDPSLKTPWDFASMIEAFYNGEYDLVSIDRTSDTTGQLQFVPEAWPYGGTRCMVA
ncbi:MAG: hypothetical protein OER86_01500, partial [Phycisphaerae bacterium]|nr:hypothetical protein [Phycisphaerae bacterium]